MVALWVEPWVDWWGLGKEYHWVGWMDDWMVAKTVEKSAVWTDRW